MWILAWGFAVQIGCLVVMIELGLWMKFLELVRENLPSILAFLETAIRFLHP